MTLSKIWVILLFGFGVALAQSIDTTRTISVQGEGSVEVRPDICVISAGVFVEDPDPVKVMDLMAGKVNQVVKTLQSYGIKKDNIQTTSLQLYPIYDTEPKTGKQILRGYRVSQNLNVIIPVKDAGKMLALLSSSGVNIINNIGFDFSKKDSVELMAIELAMENARKKAERAISGTSYSIKGIKSINIQSISRPIIYREASFAKTMVSEVPVEEGTLKISASVYVIFNFE